MISAARIFFLSLLSFVFVACALDEPAPPPPNVAVITPIAETDPVNSGNDAADDPAIWINKANPADSLVLGTDKQAGIEVYDLDGNRTQFIAAGRTNNVDLRYLDDASEWSALAAASNRTNNTISLFLISMEGELTWLQDSEIDTGLTEPYGLCMFKNRSGMQIFVNDTDGRYQQWLLAERDTATGSDPVQFEATLVREFAVSSQPEGCVADDDQQRLFVGVENEGIYAVPANHQQEASFDTVMEIDDFILAADVEGMSLYMEGVTGYLVVSVQGNFSYALYERLPPFAYRGSFMVADRADASVDGSQETDGLTVTSADLGSNYGKGLMVVQDGFNTLPEDTQNFKYLSWEDIESVLAL